MSTNNDGGPAFPVPVQEDWQCASRFTSGYGGMTLRDYFAGQSLAGLCASGAFSMDRCARNAYEAADAMLAARERKGGEK